MSGFIPPDDNDSGIFKHSSKFLVAFSLFIVIMWIYHIVKALT